MNDDLFFIPMIAWSLRQPDPVTATREVLERIARMGQEPRYQRGYQQYIQFATWALVPVLPEGAEVAAALVPEHLKRPESVALVVEKGDVLLATIPLEGDSGARVIDGIGPGAYRLSFDTGRVLWEGEIEAKDVLLRGQPLELAAGAGAAPGKPPLELPLPGGTPIVRVSPGLEAGRMVVEWRRREDNQ